MKYDEINLKDIAERKRRVRETLNLAIALDLEFPSLCQ